MANRRTLTGVTLTVLVALLAVGAFIGWRALFSPLPSESDPDADARQGCADGVARGDTVRTRDVTVSVYNAGSRAGLAGQTQDELAARGFIPGDLGNAPEDLEKVRFVRVLAETRTDPAARLVALQFGPKTKVHAAPDLGKGVEVIVGDKFKGLDKAPRKLRAKAPGSGC
ncbi:MAG TPA: LytR C-terminal domain-containing protein [Marmoricola sp.]|nr:LytR C-terminal domain-containing protein [Marmoricola sp.]